MNKIFNINLGGYPFTIDDDAYVRLNAYLSTIERHFADSEGCEEILSDIEARIAELLNDELKGQAIVTNREIDAVIKIMGTPEDFGAEPLEDTEPTTSHKRPRWNKRFKTGKKLFRDEDSKLIGGVCSGLAAYFGIEDPVWMRIGVVLFMFLTGGSLVVPYIILWAILPKAKTTADKLAMRGEPVNVSSIARTVEDEIENISETITELGREFRSKKKR